MGTKPLYKIQRSTIPENKKIVTLYEGYGNHPQWAPDEKGFMIDLTFPRRGIPSLNQEFFYVDQNRETTQVTSLNGMDISASIGFFNWSPDGKSIAFWLDDLNSPEDYPDLYTESPAGYPNRLAILDLPNRKVIDTCIPGDLSLSFPVLSLDGNYVVVDDYYGMEPLPMKGRVWLANLSEKSVYQIAENVNPMGWMQP